MIEDHDDAENLEGELITQEELASAVGDDMGSDDPVVRRLWDDLIRGEHAKAVMAEAEMRRVIEFNQSVDHRFQDGMGQLVARVPMSVYLHWAAVHGHDFWDQADSLDFLAKRAGDGRGNPGLLIKTQAKATMIVDRPFGRAQGDQQGRKLSPGAAGPTGEIMGKSSAAGAAMAPAASVSPKHSARNTRGGRWRK